MLGDRVFWGFFSWGGGGECEILVCREFLRSAKNGWIFWVTKIRQIFMCTVFSVIREFLHGVEL